METINEVWVFLSHSTKDYEKVRRVRNMLEDQSFRPIRFFLKCLSDEDEIDSLIKREIDCRTRFILCDSDNVHNSKWVQREVEYIKSKDQVYETIDLNKSDKEIWQELTEFKKRANLFFSYSMQDIHLANLINNRLSQYDLFQTWIDSSDIVTPENFTQIITHTLTHAVKKGKVICLITDAYLNSTFCKHELAMTLQLAESTQAVIPIFTKKIPSLTKELESTLSKYYPIFLQARSIEEMANDVVDGILTRVLPPGAILTCAHNFKKGINIKKDVAESERLYQLFFKLTKDKMTVSPSAFYALGQAYEYGYRTEIDLEQAFSIYVICKRVEGLPVEKDLERVSYKLYNPVSL